MALNDEDVRVRGLAVDLAGRLGHANPAVVLPALRTHLVQLLADLEHSPDSRQREGVAPCQPHPSVAHQEGAGAGWSSSTTAPNLQQGFSVLCSCAESAFLLGKLIHGAPRLVLPYVAPIEKALVAKLRSATLPPPPLAPAGPTAKAAKCVLLALDES